MSERFADTFVFLALLSRHDRKHTAAVQAMNASREPLLTTAWVLTELADGLCAAQSRALFVEMEARLRGNPRVTIIEPSQRLYDDGLELYRQRPDKDWSLTDCISFVVMRERGIVEALTGDHHFEQAGFVALLAG
jgi:predicted nucleic acid-binding protein